MHTLASPAHGASLWELLLGDANKPERA